MSGSLGEFIQDPDIAPVPYEFHSILSGPPDELGTTLQRRPERPASARLIHRGHTLGPSVARREEDRPRLSRHPSIFVKSSATTRSERGVCAALLMDRRSSADGFAFIMIVGRQCGCALESANNWWGPDDDGRQKLMNYYRIKRMGG